MTPAETRIDKARAWAKFDGAMTATGVLAVIYLWTRDDFTLGAFIGVAIGHCLWLVAELRSSRWRPSR